jgi:putative ubiquitin-RnfH superfamily antitoxin RatB of RatAB toxin-antitoxin module
MDELEPTGEIEIELVRIGPDAVHRQTLRLPGDATVLHALRSSGVLAQLGLCAGDASELDATVATRLSAQPWVLAVHGQRVGLNERLHDHDRIELLPPLIVDPKTARQRRAEHRRRQQGERRWTPDRAVEKPSEAQGNEGAQR